MQGPYDLKETANSLGEDRRIRIANTKFCHFYISRDVACNVPTNARIAEYMILNDWIHGFQRNVQLNTRFFFNAGNKLRFEVAVGEIVAGSGKGDCLMQ